MPIINRTRFLSEITQPVQTIELQALSHAIAALGAFSTVEQRGLVEACYDQARNLLDICERQERGDSLQNINTLQTCVLLTLYEFKRPNFARAWMTLGRSIRLAKLMGLDRAGGRASAAAQWGVHTPVPIPTDPSDIEERRRTFWLLYIFDAFASVRTNSSPAFETPVSIHLSYWDGTPACPDSHCARYLSQFPVRAGTQILKRQQMKCQICSRYLSLQSRSTSLHSLVPRS